MAGGSGSGVVRWASDGLKDVAGGSEEPFFPRIGLTSSSASRSDRQEALVDFLDQLCTKEPVTIASDERAARHYRSFFRRLYLDGDGFRHSYSEICHLVYDKVSPYESDGKLLDSVPSELRNLRPNLDAVIASLSVLRNHARRAEYRLRMDYESPDSGSVARDPREDRKMRRLIGDFRRDAEELEEIIKRVTKLYDHVSMEIERLGYIVRQNKCNSDAILEASETVDRAVAEKEKQLKSLSEEVEKTKRDVQRDNIAVLGIFASVVLVVNSAVSFSSASLSAIGAWHGVMPVLLMAAIVGYVVINTVGVMLAFVWRMTFKDKFDLGEWPEKAWKVANVVLIALIALLSMTRLPWFRALVGLPV